MNTSDGGAGSFTVEAGSTLRKTKFLRDRWSAPFSENHCGPLAGSWVTLLQLLLLVDASNPIVDLVQLDTCLLSLELFKSFPAKVAQPGFLPCSIMVVFF